MGRILVHMATDLEGRAACQHLWLLVQGSLRSQDHCKLTTLNSCILIMITITEDDNWIFFRIDFHPNTTENEEKAEGDEGCKRCGYKVFDAEKLMAAGRVKIVRI